MKITVGDVWSTVHTQDFRVIGYIKSVCSARPEGYMYMKKYKDGYWDGYISLSDKLTFPTGLLRRVYRVLKYKGYEKIQLQRDGEKLAYYEVLPDVLQGIELRDYQIEAIHKLLASKRGIAKMATNSGKTEIFAAMIKALNFPQTLILVTRKELMYQTVDRLKLRFNNWSIVGLIGDGKVQPATITVGMIQTLYRMSEEELNKLFFGNQVIILDECHHGSAEKALEVLEHIPGYYRYGFSGTPLKDKVLPDLKLIAYTGEIVFEIKNEKLIDEGFSAAPEIHLYEMATYVGNIPVHENMKYQQAYECFIVSNIVRNNKIQAIAKSSNGIVLVIVERIEHGNILHEMIEGSMYVNGGDSVEDRLLALENMRAGVKGVYIATSIFDEGVDVPGIDTLIMAAGGKSIIKVLQRIGRGLRKKSGENKLVVHDFIDLSNKYLSAHSQQRIKIYEQEHFRIIRE